MDFSGRKEDELLRETVRRYSTERLAPDYARWETEPFPRERVVELGDLGVLGMLIPEEFGGSAGGYVSLGVAAEEIGRADFNVTSFLQLAGITAGLLALGSDDVQKEWLAGGAAGGAVGGGDGGVDRALPPPRAVGRPRRRPAHLYRPA